MVIVISIVISFTNKGDAYLPFSRRQLITLIFFSWRAMAGGHHQSDVVAHRRNNHPEYSTSSIVGSKESFKNVAGKKFSRKCRKTPINGSCAVCEGPRSSVHFGVISCAACSAFFRRTVSENRKYSCRRSSEGGFNCPIDQQHRCYCRSCRFQKCLLMGMNPESVQLYRDTYGSKGVSPSRNERCLDQQGTVHGLAEERIFSAESPPLMLKTYVAEQMSVHPHSSSCFERRLGDVSLMSMKCELSVGHSPGNMIVLMVRSYQQMLERRRLVYCPGSIRDILNGTKPAVRPACYYGERVRRDRLRVDIALLVEFLNSINPFPSLDLDDKAALIKRFSVPFAILEKYYITMCAGGLQTNRIFHSDGTYSDLNDPDSITTGANKVRSGSVDRDTLNKLFVQSLKDFLLELSAPMYYNKMSDVEFCALNAVLLFDQAAPGLSENGCRIVREARDRVYNDWFELYRKTGVRDIGQRVGNTMLLLPAVQTIVETTQENFRLIQIFDLFQYDKILDELMYLDD
uniref:Nuclear receptor domain-containing protein n=1 Tax=Haemonchus contortus TaxID=6289 RepID=A0A7I4YIB9_HAECO